MLIFFSAITAIFKLKLNLEKVPSLFNCYESYFNAVPESNPLLFSASFGITIKRFNSPFLFIENTLLPVFQLLEYSTLLIYEFHLLFRLLFFREY